MSMLGSIRSLLLTITLSSRATRALTSPFLSTVLRPSSSSTTTCSLKIMSTAATTTTTDDPYVWLEDVESDASLEFAKASNAKCLAALGDPSLSTTTTTTTTYARILAVLESKDRIPSVTQFGHDAATGEPVLFNYWRDSSHPKGVWRKTTLTSYKQSADTVWETVLDVDQLAADDGVSWVWKGSRALPRARDTVGDNNRMVTRVMLNLSRGGSDAVHVKEFDLTTQSFVTEHPFVLPEAKSRVSYASRDVVWVGTDFGEGSLTDSGYPRTVRSWVRGTPLEDAPIIFEGEATDVSVSAYVSDERTWGGGIYEIHSRALTFYTSKYWMRKVEFEHLLAPNDPARAGVEEPPAFAPVDIPEDADLTLMGNMMIITLRSDWEPVQGTKFQRGSVVYVHTDTFLEKGKEACEYHTLFEPTERTAYEYFTATKNYLILATMDNVKSKLDFYKITDNGFVKLSEGQPQIRDCSVRPVDPYAGSDEFWFTTSDYVTPSSLFLADAGKVAEDSTSVETSTDSFIQERLKSLPPQYDTSGLDVEQRFATSKDGTKIPYFMVKKSSVSLDGTNPTLLYGYGGFEVSLGPHYVATAGLAWLERGGIYVEANIRGGGEFGPAWHQAGLKANRNKCYEDFIAVAEDLIAAGFCKPKTLAIRGGSNGGLLMGNMYTMRPDLFGAIHCAVPLLDMQRYHTLLAGASWMAEYGNPDTDDWDFLKTYSPYHNIDKDADYPPILVTTSTRDDRVHPGHARKFVKKLWDLGEGRWPVYYYENIEGGHGGAADAKQSAFMTALAYDFMFATLTENASKAK